MSCTLFWDMHSGGGNKIRPYEKIYVEAPEDDARRFFEIQFGRDPDHVTCNCCGEDYAIKNEPSFEEASLYHRSGTFGRGAAVSVDEYLARPDVLLVRGDSVLEVLRTKQPVLLPSTDKDGG